MNRIVKRRGFTLIELLVVIAIVGVLTSLLIPAVQRVRDAAARARCGNHLRQIGLGIHAYHAVQGRLPPGVSNQGEDDPYPFMSWLTRILPFAERSDLWVQAQMAYAQDKSYQHNPPHAGFATVVALYGCPADSRTAQVGRSKGTVPVGFTSYLGVEGRNQVRKDGVLFLNSSVRWADVTDGTSNTLMVGERPPSADGEFGWWYAADGQAADGSADFVLGVREQNAYFQSICPNQPGEFGPGRINNQCDVLHYWSPHAGAGANFLLADGSVRFLRYSAAPLMPALASRARGETVELP